MYSQIKQLLCEKLPRLKELSYGCEIETDGEWGKVLTVDEYGIDIARKSEIQGFSYGRTRKEWITKILGHDFTHYDILEALDGEWGLGIYRTHTGEATRVLLKMAENGSFYKYWHGDDNGGEFIVLPPILHDLDLPEHKDTATALISLLK